MTDRWPSENIAVKDCRLRRPQRLDRLRAGDSSTHLAPGQSQLSQCTDCAETDTEVRGHGRPTTPPELPRPDASMRWQIGINACWLACAALLCASLPLAAAPDGASGVGEPGRPKRLPKPQSLPSEQLPSDALRVEPLPPDLIPGAREDDSTEPSGSVTPQPIQDPARKLLLVEPQAAEVQAAAAAWWKPSLSEPLLEESRWVRFDLGTLVTDTLAHSPRILGIAQEVQIAREGVIIQDAAFDSSMLLDSSYGRTSDPVGNSLETGGPSRLRQRDWNAQFGLRRTMRHGARWEVTQRIGLLDSNSLFFIPRHQGNTRLGISLTQPLMAGAGEIYNQRLIVEAQLDAQIARGDSLLEMQNTLAELMLSYWRLYMYRSHYIQQQDLVRRGEELQRIISGRQRLDTGEAECLRVREQVALRRAELLRTRTDLQNEQTRITMLVGSPALSPERVDELIPNSIPACEPFPLDVRQAVTQGLQHRPEVAIAAAELENAALQLRVSRNQLLPQLDALVDTYVLGLNGNQDIGGSLADQFTEGEPGFSAGLQFELPVGRRAAHARHRAATAAYQKQVQAVRQAMLTTRSEVEIALREVNMALEMIQHRRQTLAAARAEEKYLQRRWELLGGGGTTIGLVVQDLLEAQQSRTSAEEQLVEAEVQYLSSLIRLQLSMGTLLLSH